MPGAKTASYRGDRACRARAGDESQHRRVTEFASGARVVARRRQCAIIPEMSVHNADIARVFDEIADLLEIEEAGNAFRIRAYRNAARTINDLPHSVESMLAGPARTLSDLRHRGGPSRARVPRSSRPAAPVSCASSARARPGGHCRTVALPGLGLKKVKALHGELKVDTLEAHRAGATGACAACRVSA